jgi:hypothetical protein
MRSAALLTIAVVLASATVAVASWPPPEAGFAPGNCLGAVLPGRKLDFVKGTYVPSWYLPPRALAPQPVAPLDCFLSVRRALIRLVLGGGFNADESTGAHTRAPDMLLTGASSSMLCLVDTNR